MPGEQHFKLKCGICGLYAALLVTDFTELTQRSQSQSLDCCYGDPGRPCKGKMEKFGQPISATRTVANLPNYLTRLERTANARGAKRKAAEDLAKDASKRAREAQEDGLEADEEDDSDPDFLLALDFKIEMRFTRESMEESRPIPAPPSGWDAPPNMTTGVVLMGNRNDAERRKPTKDNSYPKTTAWRYSLQKRAPNARAYQKGSLSHYEWCHLQGVSLGGMTVSDNLACGHYAVNTYMGVIESFLTTSGKQRPIKVTAVCNEAYVVDWVRYQIYEGSLASPNLKADIWIDGHITRFSLQDQLRVQDNLRDQGLR